MLLALGVALTAVSPTTPASAAGAGPFTGAGAWVSIFSGAAVWDHPATHVARMQRAGVRTLYLQTSSSASPVRTQVFRRTQVARFLVAAHARGMRVVAWYLPPLRHTDRELSRAMAAIRLRTAGGQRFDGFALDIEPSGSTPAGARRNANLAQLSRRLRASAGRSYPLGAIIPSAVGLSLSPRFWPAFPYETVGRYYDVVLPMSYSTSRVSGATATYDYTMRNIVFLRERLGPLVAVHVIGGDAGRSSRLETRGFVQACNDAGVAGASMWHYTAYGVEDWQEMNLLHG